MNKNFLEEKSILIAPFFIVLFVIFVPISPSIKSIMAVLSLAAVLLTPYYRKQLGSAFNTLWGRAAVLFFAYIVIASLWSDAPFSMRLSVIDKYSKLIYLPILAVGFIHPSTRKWSFNVYFAVMLLTCVLSILKQKGLIMINNPEDSGEVFHNHIATGYMVDLAIYFAALMCFRPNIGKWQRAYYLLMILVGSYQIFFYNTGRTGYFMYGLLISLLIIQKLSFKKAVIGFFLLASFMGIIYSVSPLMKVRTAALISDIKFLQQHQENTSLGFRVQFHQYARSLFKQHPIIGIGTGNFKHRFSQEQPIPAWDPVLNDPHSQYWFTLTEQGIIGLILLIGFMGCLFVSVWKLDNEETKHMLIGLLVSFMFGSISDTILCFSTAGSLLMIFCAIGFSEQLAKNPVQETMPERYSAVGVSAA